MKPARDLRRILDGIARREPAAYPSRASAAAPLLFGRLPRRSRPRVAEPAPGPRLADVLTGEEVAVPGLGKAYRVTTRVAAPVDPPEAGPEAPLFLDIEATGLSCSPLFLIGAMTCEEGELEVRQYLARDYAEEAAVISLFGADAAGRGRLVSFNGKSYDLPYIRMRAAATGVPFRLDLPHTDLLHEARRAWGGELPDCRLQTLEALVLGQRRHDDIPGAEIPDAYHAFVRTGDAADLARIVRHNRRDLVTLAELLARLGV